MLMCPFKPLTSMVRILMKAYCVHGIIDIKPIYLNKPYLFQNKIYCLDKFYFCFAKGANLYKLSWLPCSLKNMVLTQCNIKVRHVRD